MELVGIFYRTISELMIFSWLPAIFRSCDLGKIDCDDSPRITPLLLISKAGVFDSVQLVCFSLCLCLCLSSQSLCTGQHQRSSSMGSTSVLSSRQFFYCFSIFGTYRTSVPKSRMRVAYLFRFTVSSVQSTITTWLTKKSLPDFW